MELSQLRQKLAELEQLRSAHTNLGKQLSHTISLLNATIESTADGLLVIDNDGKIVSYNNNFLKLWRIPSALAEQREDKVLLDFVLNQLQAPETFLKKVQYLYSHPEEESFDVLEFKDGRVFERFSKPQRIGENIIGRVWSFRDVTAHTQVAAEREKLLIELEGAMERIRTLQGLLPVCARCKRVRDDKGYRDAVEKYIAKHTDADVPFGVCPECMKEARKGKIKNG